MIKQKIFESCEDLVKFVNECNGRTYVDTLAISPYNFILFYKECKHEFVPFSDNKIQFLSGDTIDSGPYYAKCRKCDFIPTPHNGSCNHTWIEQDDTKPTKIGDKIVNVGTYCVICSKCHVLYDNA